MLFVDGDRQLRNIRTSDRQIYFCLRVPCLRPILSCVADLTVEPSVGPVVIGQAVQEAVALKATETVLVITKAL